MKIKFLGAAEMVTGSCFLLTSNAGSSILIDCGMFQGSSAIEDLNFEPLKMVPSELSGVLLTHAHLDHCARLPLLIRNGYNGNIWMTPPTADITEITLYDTAKVGRGDVHPLFTNDDVERTLPHFKTVEYDKTFNIGEFNITFRDAGHILGSASIEIVDTATKGDIKKITFSGDLGNSPEPLIKPTEQISSSDVVVMESTYGDRFHPNEKPEEKIASEIQEIEKTGGILLIPAFSVERSQDLLHIISHLKKDGKIKNDTHIVFDGPMGEKVTAVFEKYHDYYNKELSADASEGNPFDFPGLTIGETDTEGSKVIIAGSGMMAGGKIVKYAAESLDKPSTRLLIVGYQAEGTLGRRLLDGEKEVRINGMQVYVRATISDTHAMSSHADQAGLLKWLKSINGVKKVFITHGEDSARTILAGKIESVAGIKDAISPKLNEEIEI